MVPQMRWVLAALTALLLCSCLMGRVDYRELAIPDESAGDIWQQVVTYANSRALRADMEQTDPGLRVYQSSWSGTTAAFGRGTRERFYAQIEPTRGSTGWVIRFHCEVHRLAYFSPRNPEESDWEFVGQNRAVEDDFERFMRITFKLKH